MKTKGFLRIVVALFIGAAAFSAAYGADVVIDSFDHGPQQLNGTGNFSGPLNGSGSNKGTSAVYDGPGPIGDRRELVATEGHPVTSTQTISGNAPGTSTITWSGSNGATNQSMYYGSAIRPAPVSLNVDLSGQTAFEAEFAQLKPGVIPCCGNGWLVQVFIDTTGPLGDPAELFPGTVFGSANFTWCGGQHPHPSFVVMTAGCYIGFANLPYDADGPVTATIDFADFVRYDGFGVYPTDTLDQADRSNVHGITFSTGNNGNFATTDRNAVLSEIRFVNNDAPPDADEDGVADENDNCPNDANANQADADNDAAGDVCDDDDDNDGVLDGDDVCQGHDDTIDVDGDGTPDGCDSNNNDGPLGDLDGDGVNNQDDDCDATADGDAINGSGCSVTDLCDCDTARNHGNYVSCVTRTANDFRREGLISNKDKSSLTKAAAKTSCGK